jgi:DNA-binding LacI/PurR family transcriptional regulator
MDPNLMDDLAESKIPVVFYDVGAARRNISNIRVNYQRGIEKVVDYLHDLGHRRMGFISHHSTLGPIDVRQKAFIETVSRYSPPIEWTTAVDADGLEGGRQAAREMLASGFRPTSIICVNDFMAVGVLRELREQGIQVPSEVSVTGFDNIKLSEFCSPALTTLHIPRELIGRIAFETLIPDPEKPRPAGREIVIDPEFVLRGSTGPAPRSI